MNVDVDAIFLQQCWYGFLENLHSDKKLNEIIRYVKPRSFTEKRYCITTSGLIKSLGCNEQVSFEQGLEKIIQWIKLNPDYWIK